MVTYVFSLLLLNNCFGMIITFDGPIEAVHRTTFCCDGNMHIDICKVSVKCVYMNTPIVGHLSDMLHNRTVQVLCMVSYTYRSKNNEKRVHTS